MRLLKQMYITDDISRQAPQIIEDLKAGVYHTTSVLLTCDIDGDGTLSMVNIQFLRQGALRERLPLIIGIASQKSSAIELTGQIITEVLQETGGFDYKAYFSAKEQIIGRS